MKKANIGFLVVIFLILMMFAGCGGIKPQLHLTILRHSWLKEFQGGSLAWWVEITGEAENTGNVDLDYAEIHATFFDSEDSIITKEFTNTIGIPVNEIWHFKILYWHNIEPVRYELAVSGLTKW